MGALAGQVLVAVGGTGWMGRAVVGALLDAGATVVVPTRGGERARGLGAAFADRGDRLRLHRADLLTPDGAASLREMLVQRHGTIDGITVSVHGWWSAAHVRDLPLPAWERALAEGVLVPVGAMRALLPLVVPAASSSCTLLTGLVAESPLPRAAAASVIPAAQLMAVRVLMSEHATDTSCRVNAVLLGEICRSSDAGRRSPDWLTPDDVGALAVWLASAASRHVRGRVVRAANRAALARATYLLRDVAAAPAHGWNMSAPVGRAIETRERPG